MKPKSAQQNRTRVHSSGRLALLSLAIVGMIAAVALQSPRPSAAGSLAPLMYLPLVDHDAGVVVAETATVVPATSTATSTATETATATKTATSEPVSPVDLSGTVYVRSAYHILVPPEPVAYVVVLDTSGSMSLNFDGEARDINGSILQCLPSSDPARQAKYEQDRSRCQQIQAVWQPQSERRITVVKAALTNLVDRMAPFDSMQVVGFSARDANGAGVQTATAGWLYGTPAGKQALKQAVLEVGKTNADPYLTSGGTPSATGLRAAYTILNGAPAQSTDGRDFKHTVLLLTDGVPNYFLKPSNPGTGFGWYNDAHDNPDCATRPDRDYVGFCQGGLTNTSPEIERPINAMVSEADRVKQLNGGSTSIHVIALADFDNFALPNVASQATFPYYSDVTTAADVDADLVTIGQAISGLPCTPGGRTAFLGSIDAAHTVTDTAERARLGLPADQSIYGYAYLSDVNGNVLQSSPVRHDANGQLSYAFSQIVAGTYRVQAFVAYQGDDQPAPVARAYDWILLPNLLHDTSRTFIFTPSQALGSVQLDPLNLDLQGSVCPDA